MSPQVREEREKEEREEREEREEERRRRGREGERRGGRAEENGVEYRNQETYQVALV